MKSITWSYTKWPTEVGLVNSFIDTVRDIILVEFDNYASPVIVNSEVGIGIDSNFENWF